jgi:deoxyguanosine kinase
LKNIIIEGARGVGKSSVTKILREKTTNSTLINFTGFNEDGMEGLIKVNEYYAHWMSFFKSLKESGQDMTFIHDRFYLSEMVYSLLYKKYSFEVSYNTLNSMIEESFDDVVLVLLTLDDRNIKKRLKSRDKEKLFGKEEESARQSMIQQSMYLNLLSGPFSDECYPKNLKIHYVDTVGKTPEKIAEEILSL